MISNFEWDFKEMQPMFAFCNWQFKVEGYAPHSSESENLLIGHTVTVKVASHSEPSTVEMVSALDL